MILMVSVAKGKDGNFQVNDDGSLLSGDDFATLDEVKHLPRERGTVNGKDMEIVGGYVRADELVEALPT